MTQPDHASFERFAADQAQRLPSTRPLLLGPVVVNDALYPGQAIDGGMDQRAELIDQTLLQELAIDRAASLEEKLLDTEDGSELVHGTRKVVTLRAGEDVGYAVFAQLGQIDVRHLLA